jgi:hypothetical protein
MAHANNRGTIARRIAAGVSDDEELMQHLDVVRARVQREALIHTYRENLSPWDFAKLVTDHPKVTSRRPNASKITHRTINGLLLGEKSNANTVLMVQRFLQHSMNLPDPIFNVSKRTVDAAKAQLGFVRPIEKGRILPSTLAHYVGVYTVRPELFGPVRLTLIIDHDTVHNILLVRAVLITRHKCESRTSVTAPVQYSIDAFLYGYAVPNDKQLVIELRDTSETGSYKIVVSDPKKSLARPASVAAPRQLTHPYEDDRNLVALKTLAWQPGGFPAFADHWPEAFEFPSLGAGGLPAHLQFPPADDELISSGLRIQHDPYLNIFGSTHPCYVFSKCNTHPAFEDVFLTGFNWMLIWRHRARKIYIQELEKRELEEFYEQFPSSRE